MASRAEPISSRETRMADTPGAADGASYGQTILRAADQRNGTQEASHPLVSEVSPDELFELLKALQRRLQHTGGRSPNKWLSRLSDEQLQELIYFVGGAHFVCGDFLFVAKEQPMFAAIILSGSAGEARGSELVVRTAGDFAGDDVFLSNKPRRHDCVCLEDGVVALIPLRSFCSLKSRLPSIFTALLNAIARGTDAYATTFGDEVQSGFAEPASGGMKSAAPPPSSARRVTSTAVANGAGVKFDEAEWEARCESTAEESYLRGALQHTIAEPSARHERPSREAATFSTSARLQQRPVPLASC